MAIQLGTGQRTQRYRHSLSSEINVTPFVDVMLVLLIIFMVASPMLVPGIEVDLPQNEAGPLTGQDESLVVTIDKNGITYIQEAPVLASELAIKLKAILKEKNDTRIFLRGDRNVSYGKIMEIFAALRGLGLNNVSLVTKITSHSKGR